MEETVHQNKFCKKWNNIEIKLSGRGGFIISNETEKLLFQVMLKIVNAKMLENNIINEKQKKEIDKKISEQFL